MSQAPMDVRSKAPYQWLALAVGVIYLLIGVIGFFVTGVNDFFEHDPDRTLLGFAINPMHNLVHVLTGLLGVFLWMTRRGARIYGWFLLAAYGAVVIYGFIVMNNPDWDILNLNAADMVLHIVTALVGLAIALWPERRLISG
jgi:hypothetical protein